MARQTSAPLPRVSRILVELGQNLRLARTRRKLSAGLVAERAGMTRPTLRAIERGDAGVTLGAVANVLNSLGLAEDLAAVARDDKLGRQLEDAQLQSKQRVRREKPSGS
jgi:transcriptional regulator with XRE-family HTH domain